MAQKITTKVLPPAAYDNFLSEKAFRLKPNPIRSLLPMEKNPGMISLLAGKPNPSTFPITSLSFTTRHPAGRDEELTLSGVEMEDALQYNLISGLPELVRWITGLQEHSHQRTHEEGWRVSIGVGSQDLLQKCFSGIFNEGDAVFIETPAYPGIVPLFQSMNLEMIEIPTDEHGILAQSLRDELVRWPHGKKMPKALYTVPVGSNPTGYTASYDRRMEVLNLARQYEFLILEDDPYYYLYYGVDPRPPSYFTLEAENNSAPAGRVIRFDSLSKILSSGFRLGFVTGPPRILDVIDGQTGLSNLQASTLAQGIALKILQSWGYDNFIAHTRNVSAFYKSKRDICAAAFERHLKNYAEWVVPEAGMFLWFELKIPSDENGVCDSEKLIRESAMKKGVLALPGIVAYPLQRKSAHCRASFSLLSAEDVDEACRRLAEVVSEAQKSIV